MAKPRVVYWFRTDLRLHDSPALNAAIELQPECLYPIWAWDPHYVYRARVGTNRFQFLIDCQKDVSESITKLNEKSKLLVLREAPQTLFPKLFKAWRISHLVFEKDTDAYGRDRDNEIIAIAEMAGVEIITRSGRTLWDSDELVKANGGKPTMSISQVQNAGKKLGAIAAPLPTPTSLPAPGDLSLEIEQEQPPQKPDMNMHHRGEDEKSYSSGIAGPMGNFSVPTLEELGMKPATTQHKGGESVALEILDKLFADEEYMAKFEKPKTSPAAFEPQSTCLTSSHLHFGALSCRYFYHRAEELIKKRKKDKKAASDPPTSLTGQLLFRDMYFAAQAALGWSFGQTYNNDHCRFIPWHLPSKVDTKSGLITRSYEVDDPEKEEWFQRWAYGKTGFPWIDALMRQLRQEGWIHHLGRHSVACFLTRGGCYISWERGAEVFEELLIDHEAACNIGNWQWLSCTAFYAQFYRCYSPIAFPKKWDDQGDFVRRYVSELKDFPKKYIYEPWNAPIQDQKKAGCLIKGNGDGSETDATFQIYPKPIFDFAKQRDVCISGMKSAYKIGLMGNSPKVMDGSWRECFDDSGEGPTEGSKGGPGGMTKFEDVDGMEEAHHVEPATPKHGAKGESPGSRTEHARSHKRERSQGTLDGAFIKKTRK